MKDYIPEPPSMKVTCYNCNQRFISDKVKFINIESDFYERDVLTFECPNCKKEQKSLIFY